MAHDVYDEWIGEIKQSHLLLRHRICYYDIKFAITTSNVQPSFGVCFVKVILTASELGLLNDSIGETHFFMTFSWTPLPLMLIIIIEVYHSKDIALQLSLIFRYHSNTISRFASFTSK